MTPSTALLLKLTLAPSLVGSASLLMPRVGPRVAGLVTALPVVTGPLLLVYALEQGHAFAAAAASKTLFGTVALLAYTTAYVQLARAKQSPKWPWLCLALGWCAFVSAAVVLNVVAWPKLVGIPMALTATYCGAASLPRAQSTRGADAPRAPSLTLLCMRMAAAALLVWALSSAASALGPTWSGLFSAFPVVSTIMLVATHLDHGLDTALGWLRGFYWGLFGYVAFVVCVAYTLVPWGIARSFGTGIAGAVGIQMLVQWAPWKRSSRQPR